MSVLIAVSCDEPECGFVFCSRGAETKVAARTHAKLMGWSRERRGEKNMDLCPKHSGESRGRSR